MPPAVFFRAIGVTCIWGLNFSLIKYCLAFFDPYTLSGLRFLLCAVPLVFFVPRPDAGLRWVAAYGIAFGIGTWGMVNLGVQSGVSPGVASLVLQTSALFTLVFGAVIFREPLTVGKLAGLAIAGSGLLVLGEFTDGSATLPGVLLVLLGALCWGLANSIVKYARPKRHFAFLVWSSLFSPLPLFLLGHLYGGTRASPAGPAQYLLLLVLLLATSYVATLFCYRVWNRLIASQEMSRIAPLSLLVPVFGFAGSALFFGEEIGAGKILACGAVLTGVLVAVRGDELLYRLGFRPWT